MKKCLSISSVFVFFHLSQSEIIKQMLMSDKDNQNEKKLNLRKIIND